MSGIIIDCLISDVKISSENGRRVYLSVPYQGRTIKVTLDKG